jgi:MFS family permease
MLGDGLAALAVPLLVLQLTGNPVLAALASAPRSIGYLAAGIPAGLLADRIDPCRVLIGADVFRAAAFLGLFAVTGLHRGAVAIVLVLACSAGAATVFFETSLAIAVRDVFTGPRLMAANAWLEAANQVGQVLGPGAAGLLAAIGLLRLAMLIDAFTFGVSWCSLVIFLRRAGRGMFLGPAGRGMFLGPAGRGMFLGPAGRGMFLGRAGRGMFLGPAGRGSPGATRPAISWAALRRELADGIRYLAATRVLFALLIFVLVLNLCLGADKLIIFLAKDTLRLPVWQVGLVISAGGAGGILGAAGASWWSSGAVGSRWWRRRREPVSVVTICAAVSGIALILIATAGSMPVMLAGNLLYSWAIVAASVTMRVLRQVLVPRELLGRVTAAWRLGGQVVTPLGAILAGTATGLLGGNSRPVFAVAGALTIVTVLAAWVAGVRPDPAPA